jgi:hypothetical protein
VSLVHRRLILSILAAAHVASVVVSALQPEGELRLKAAFIFRFPQFVTWPASAVDGRSTFDLCILASGQMASFVEELVRGESVEGRPIRVIPVRTADVPASCHALAIAGRTAAAVLKQTATKPVLTIGDSPSFLDDGGIIALRIVEQRVRFEVDLGNAQRAGLQLSSQLLRLALSVRGGPA